MSIKTRCCKVLANPLYSISLPVLGGGSYERVLDSSCEFWNLGKSLVGERNEHLLALTVTTWVQMLSDSPWGYKPRMIIHKFIKQLLSDPFGLIASYDALALRLQRSMERSDVGIPIIRPLLSDFRDTPIFKEYHLYLTHRDPQFLAYILSFLSFAKKVTWFRPELESAALRDWIELEEQLGSVKQPAWSKKIRTVMEVLTENWSDFTFFPKHGNGAVAQKLGRPGLIKKNKLMHTPEKIRRTYGYRSNDQFGYIDHQYLPLIEKNSDEEVFRSASRLAFVPKSYKAVRSICMEPVSYQYAQQGVLHWMTRNMNQGLVSRFINLRDQGFNRAYAQLGSRTTQVDTIDLSSASDSVRWELVKQVFPSKVLKHLAATRTKAVEIEPGKVVSVHKFAPMGSATCFPVQSLLYLAFSIFAGIAVKNDQCPDDLDINHELVRRYIRSTLAGKMSDTNKHCPPRIFGDDIICDKRVTSLLVSLLQLQGFSVNTEKSFFGDAGYRESCGGHYCYGDDVTFFSLKATVFKRRLSVEQLGSLIDQANLALDNHYKAVRDHLVRVCLYTPILGVRRDKGPNPILFTDTLDVDSTFAFRSLNPHNQHLTVRKWQSSSSKTTASRFQRDEVRSIEGVATKHIQAPVIHDWYYYMQWWRERDYAEGTPRNLGLDINTSSHSPDTVPRGVAWRWTPRASNEGHD